MNKKITYKTGALLKDAWKARCRFKNRGTTMLEKTDATDVLRTELRVGMNDSDPATQPSRNPFDEPTARSQHKNNRQLKIMMTMEPSSQPRLMTTDLGP
jgi:hypothetical protein